MIQVKFLVSTEDFSLLQIIQTGSGANPASYSVGTRSSMSDVKSGCTIRNLTSQQHLKLRVRIVGVKLFLHVRAIVMNIREVSLYIYWLCSCKYTAH